MIPKGKHRTFNELFLEIQIHDLNRASFFFPIISPEAVNPSTFGEKKYDLPKPYSEEEHDHHQHHTDTGHKDNGIRRNIVNSFLLVLFVYIVCW